MNFDDVTAQPTYFSMGYPVYHSYRCNSFLNRFLPDFPVNRVNTVRNTGIPEKEPEIPVFRKKGLKYRLLGKKPDTVNSKKYAYTVANLKIYVPTYPYK